MAKSTIRRLSIARGGHQLDLTAFSTSIVIRSASRRGCANPPIFVPSVLGRNRRPFFDSTDSTTQLQYAHLSDGSGHDALQTSTKDSLVQHTRWNNKPFKSHVDQGSPHGTRLAIQASRTT